MALNETQLAEARKLAKAAYYAIARSPCSSSLGRLQALNRMEALANDPRDKDGLEWARFWGADQGIIGERVRAYAEFIASTVEGAEPCQTN